MRSLLTLALGSALFASANAQIFLTQYPTENATVVSSTGELGNNEIGYFWSVSRGDSVVETFDTGLMSANKLALNLNVSQNFLSNGAFVDWDVRLNGQSVGMLTINEGFTGYVNEEFYFSDVMAMGDDDFTIGLYVTNEVASGEGSIALSRTNSFAAICAEPVPEPASMAALGVGALALLRRRRKA